jgi:hypothetical protein
MVTFNRNFDKGQLEGICYTGVHGSNARNCVVETGDFQVNFKAQDLKAGEGLTVSVKFPKGYATVLEPVPDKTSFIATLLTLLLDLIMLVFYLVLPVYLLIKFISRGKKLKDSAKIVAAWFSPPKSPSGAELTPVETVMMTDVSAGKKAISATLLSLAQRGFIKIRQKEDKEFSFAMTDKKPDGSLRNYEKDLYEAIFSGEHAEVSTKDLAKNTKFGTAVSKLPPQAGECLVKVNLFEKNPVNSSTGYLTIGIFSLVFLNIFLSAVAI